MASENTPETPAPAPAEELKKIGRYELIDKIGKGGMGMVYRGRDPVIGRMVAVKTLISDIDVSEETRERFFREAKSAGQLTHRNIITIYDFGEENGKAYIVMELLNGEPLTKRLERPDKMPLEQQVEIMCRLCDGLAFAHARGTVHRDIKPANLFITNEGQFKILDFGVARIASSKLTKSGLIVGTPDYMSPEQVMGSTVDQRSDIFSAGTVSYQLLTGRKPFAARRLPEVLDKVLHETPPPLTPEEAPPELAAIVMKALEKDPTKRFQRMVDMLASLMRFLQSWERQTREMALQAATLYQENERMIAAQPAPADGSAREEVAAAPLLRELPMYADRGGDVLKLVPFRRAKIMEITALLQEQHDRLAAGQSAG